MIFHRIDPETGEFIECGQRTVTCRTAGCENENVGIEVADDPASPVQCGPCGQWIIPPEEPEEPEEPEDPEVP